MARRGKKKSKASSSTVSEDDDASRPVRGKAAKLVVELNDSEDEEIDEDEAFNSEDEKLFGHFFQDKSVKRMQGDDGSDDASGEDEDEITSDEDGEKEDDDSDDDEENDGDDDSDGGQYMLQLLDKLDSAAEKRKNSDKPASAIQMAKLSESEYSSSISKKGLTLDNLMEGLEDTKGFKIIQQSFAKQKNATSAPLEKIVADRTQRKLAYESQSKNLARWTKIVQENRQAETLDFKPKENLHITRDTLVEKFEPTTEFEKELEQALVEAGQHDDEAVLRAEEQALQDDLGANRLTLEEYKKRRGQLAQIRALMFYHEQKRHHIKKIKSKKYRRIRKKQRERLNESAIEQAMEEGGDLAKELREKEEVERIQERMTLAHKNTSKWAKRVLKRGKNVDLETRRALSAQVKRGDDLRRKMTGEKNDSDSENDSDEDLVESARKVLKDTEEDADPTKGKTGLFKLSFMQKGMIRQRDKARDEARRLLSELQENDSAGFGDSEDSSGEEHDNEKKVKATASDREMKSIIKDGELVATTLEFGNSNSISMSGGIDIDLSGEGQDNQVNQDNHVNDKNCEVKDQNVRVITEHVSMMNSAVSPKVKDKPPSLKKTSQPNKCSADQRATQSFTKFSVDEDEANPWLPSAEDDHKSSTKNSNTSVSKNTKRKGMVDIEGAADILDSDSKKQPFLASKTTVNDDKKLLVPDDATEKRITLMTQEELIRRAFASTSEKEADEEFQKEKQRTAEENDPTRKVADEKGPKEVAGWGSWTGAGALPPPRKQKLPKKLQAPLKKDDPKRKRQDDGKPNVIINQKRLKKMANTFMLGDVPHPYTSRAEYEQAMLAGVGREWNVTSSFKNMTRPEILTRSGKIIQPISKKAKIARAPAKF